MIYRYWLANATKVNRVTLRRLFDAAGPAQEIYRLKKQELEKICHWGEGQLDWFLQYRQKWELQKEWEKLVRSGIHLVTLEEADYPVRLRELCDAPYGLFYYGNIHFLQKRAAAVVGARRCSEYGRQISEKLGFSLAKAGVVVISGMAEGIDAAAHCGALKAMGETAAVFGCGVNVCYPAKNRPLYDKIRQTGCILSEFPPSSEPVGWHFPVRNRIISALCETLVVVEAKEKSGSLITADCALEQGRDVYAVPGRMTDLLSRGSNGLIRQGAGIITDVDSFLEEINVSADSAGQQMSLKFPLEKDEMLLYSCFDLNPKGLGAVVAESPFPYEKMLPLLFSLQSKGYIREIFKNHYVKII